MTAVPALDLATEDIDHSGDADGAGIIGHIFDDDELPLDALRVLDDIYRPGSVPPTPPEPAVAPLAIVLPTIADVDGKCIVDRSHVPETLPVAGDCLPAYDDTCDACAPLWSIVTMKVARMH